MELDISEDVKKEIERIVGFKYSYITVDDAVDILSELVWEIERLETELNELRQDIEENYRPISLAEQYGISDKDFI